MTGSIVNEEELLALVRTHIVSVHSLELLLLVKRQRDRSWQTAELVRELRRSSLAVAQSLASLRAAGLVREIADGRISFAPISPQHDRLAAEIEKIYAATPLTLLKAIVAAPDEKLRIFSDAFKLKE